MEVRKIAKKTITVIEPKQALLVDKAKYQQTRMAAYCRVSTDSAEQKTSYETQKQVYTDMISPGEKTGRWWASMRMKASRVREPTSVPNSTK